MEAVSFALAIPGIFTSCVDCYQYVQFGRAFERDFGASLCKLQASELRLTRWGATMGIDGPDSKLADHYGEEDLKRAYHWLQEIEESFASAIKTSARFTTSSTATPETLQVLDTHAELTKGDSSLKGLHSNMRRVIDGRLKPRRRDRVAWALYKRGAYGNLVENISELVNNLLELFPSTADRQEQLCKDEVKDLSSGSLSLLGDMIGDQDGVLRRVLENELKGRTLHMGDVHVKDDFMGHIGDIVESGGQPRGIDIKSFVGSGHSVVHIGSNIGTVVSPLFSRAARRV